jgi:hypothetical protein
MDHMRDIHISNGLHVNVIQDHLRAEERAGIKAEFEAVLRQHTHIESYCTAHISLACVTIWEMQREFTPRILTDFLTCNRNCTIPLVRAWITKVETFVGEQQRMIDASRVTQAEANAVFGFIGLVDISALRSSFFSKYTAIHARSSWRLRLRATSV